MGNESSYDLLEEVGRGAMGRVFKAKDKNLNRFVAIKVLKKELCSEEKIVERFKREATLASRLNHTNIVTLYGVEYFEDHYRIIFEYVEGMSLAQLISKMGPQEPKYALELVQQAALALREAHAADLIHRDIKPHNILLSQDGRIKVTDFGLARAFREESDLTADGLRLGTPRYMSPEQVQAAPLTHHTDIYSLGVVLYELLAGKPVFSDADPLAIMHRVVEGPFPDIRGVNARIKNDVAKIIAKMVARSPLDRYHSAEMLYDDIAAWFKHGVAPEAELIVLQHEDDPAFGSARGAPSAPLMVRGDETDFILHHVDSDHTWAEWIEAQLSEAGYKVELAPWDFKKSQESLRELINAAKNRSCVMSVVSPKYLTSLHSNRRWSVALHRGELTVFPVIVSACFLGTTFNTNYYIDLSELTAEEGKKALLDQAVEVRGIPERSAGSTLESMLRTKTPTKLMHGLWSVPVDANPHYVGRAKIFTKLESDLAERGGMCTLIQPNDSDVGLGLTQVAAEYAHMNRSTYSLVWWIRAQRQGTLLGDYVALADEIGLPEKDTPNISVRSKAVKRWLANNRDWLIIFDGARSLDYIATLLPSRMIGHAILTSSSTGQWPESANPTTIPPLERAESVQLLFNRTGERNEGAAASLASCLGDVPLALTLAAGHIKATGITIDAYIEQFLNRHKEMWRERSLSKASPMVVTTVTSLSVEQISRRSAGALSILKLCSYLAYSDIPISRLCSSAVVFPKVLSKILLNTSKLNEELALLGKFQIVHEKNDRLSVHHVVQELVNSWIETDAAEESNQGKALTATLLQSARFERKNLCVWAETALKFVKESTPEDPLRSDDTGAFARLQPHTEIVLRHANRLSLSALDQSVMWKRVGLYQFSTLDYPRAARAYKNAIDHARHARGEKHSDVSDLYRELAHIHRVEGNFDRARAAYETALDIDTKLYGSKHKSISSVLFSLGSIYMHIGDLARARQYYSQALEVDLEVDGRESEDTGRDYTYMGLVSQELGDLTSAWEYYKEALEILDIVFDEHHERVSSAVKNLAGLLQTMGDLAHAQDLYRRAIEIDVARHGERHPEVAQNYNNLGIVEEGLGMLAAAREHYSLSLEINKAVYGRHHIKVAINQNNLGNMLRRQGELDKALEHYRNAIQTFEKTLGKDHEKTATAIRNMAKIKAEMKQKG